MPNLIEAVGPPALPLAGLDYDRSKQDQTNNILRLFFYRFVNNLRTLLAVTDNGGRVLYFPRGTFVSTADQAISVADTEQAVTFSATGITSGITLVTSTKITAAVDGVYTFHFSGQLDKVNAGVATMLLWYDKNGTGVTDSTRKYAINGATDETVGELNFSVELNATDYIEIMMASDDTDAKLDAIAAAGAHPGIPSAMLSVTYTSNG